MIYSYRRVSTEEQHNGPKAQMDAIDRWLIVHNSQSVNRDAVGVQLVGDELASPCRDYFDNGVSGSIPFAERPEGGKLCERLEQDKNPPTVVVAKLDRLFRSVADAATTLAHWAKVGIKLVSIGEGFDMTNAYGLAMCQMASVFAELERSMIRERTKAALQAKKARGERCGAVPYGQTLVDGALVANPAETSVIDWILLKRNDWTTREIADWLNSRGTPAKKGGKWSHSTIADILRSRDS